MKDFTYLALMDIYGEALTEKQRNMLSDYYERDYSLAEIADNYGVSRQAVHSAVKQAEESLSDFESKFRIRAFLISVNRMIDELASCDTENSVMLRKITALQEYIRSVYGTVR